MSRPNGSSTANQGSRIIISVAAVVVVIAGIQAAESVLTPLLLAVFITIISSPILSWLRRLGLSAVTSVLLVLVVLLGFGSLFGFLLGRSLQEFSAQLPQYQTLISQREAELLQWLKGYGIDFEDASTREWLNPKSATQYFAQFVSALLRSLSNLVIILVMVSFMLAEIAWLPDKLQAATQNNFDTMDRAGRIVQNIRRYIAIKTVVSLLTGIIVWGGTWWLEIPYSIVWGFLAFVLNYIPNIGSIIAAIPAIAVALVLKDVTTAILISALYIFVNQLFGSFIEPRWQGRGLGLSPLVVFVSLLFWGWVLGPIGMLLSAPLTMAVKIALEGYEDTRWLAILLGGRPQTIEAREKVVAGGD